MSSSVYVLLAYIAVMTAIVLRFTDRAKTLEQMLVGNRNIGKAIGALSIGATWIWAPALFTSSQKAYTQGYVGLLWFLVPNVLTLLIFVPFARKLNVEFTDGFTLPAYMGKQYSNRVKVVYNVQMSTVSILSTAVQIIAGAGILNILTGIPYVYLTLAIAAMSFVYSQWSGIKASIAADAVSMIVMLVVAIGVVIALVSKLGVSSIAGGIGGISGNYDRFFDGNGLEVFLTFGLSTAIGLISGTFGDQNFWQLSLSMRKGSVGSAYKLGAVFFAIVPLSLGLVGFMAAGSGYVASNTQFVNLELIQHYLPNYAMLPFLFMVIGGLLSTVDSNTATVAALASDIVPKYNLKKSRISIFVLLILAVLVANIKGITVSHLFLIYGTVRATTLLTTIFTFKGVRLTERGVFYGVLAGIVLAIPVFVYGSIADVWQFRVAGSLVAALTSGIVSLLERPRARG